MRKSSKIGATVVKLTALGLVSAAVLVACGGSSSDPVKVVAVATAAPVTVSAATPAAKAAAEATIAAVVAAPVDQKFTFAASVPNLALTTSAGAASTVSLAAGTTIQLAKATSTAAPASFAMVTEGKTVKGDFKIGSCIFTITESAFVAPHPLAVGGTITVNPCSLTVTVPAGTTANGTAVTSQANLVMGTTQSTSVQISAAVDASGNVVVSGANVATVTVVPGTGG